MSAKQYILTAVLAIGWLFVGAGIAMNWRSFWIGLHAKEGEKVPSGVVLMFGLMGVFLAYTSIHLIEQHFAVSVPWPWLWVFLPLFLDVYSLGAFVLALFGFARKEEANGPR